MFRKSLSLFAFAALVFSAIEGDAAKNGAEPLCFLAPHTFVSSDPIGIQTQENSREREIVEAIALAQSTVLIRKEIHDFNNVRNYFSLLLTSREMIRKASGSPKLQRFILAYSKMGTTLDLWEKLLRKRDKENKDYNAVMEYYLNNGSRPLDFDPRKDENIKDMIDLGKSLSDVLKKTRRTTEILEEERGTIGEMRSLFEDVHTFFPVEKREKILDSLNDAEQNLAAIENIVNFIQAQRNLDILDLKESLISLKNSWNRIPRVGRFNFHVVFVFKEDVQLELFKHRGVSLKPILPVFLSIINEVFSKGPPKEKATVTMTLKKKENKISVLFDSDYSSIGPSSLANNELFVLSKKYPSLAVAHELTKLVVGTLEVHPKGKGIVFELTLPITANAYLRWTAPKVAPLPEAKSPEKQAPGETQKSLKILLVDDKANLLDALKDRLLEEDPSPERDLWFDRLKTAQIETAVDGPDGFDKYTKAAQEGHPYDLIITDLEMPTYSGIVMTEFIRAFENEKKLSFSTQIILVSGSIYDNGKRDESVKDFIKYGINAALGKPLNFNRLKTEIKRLLEGKKPLTLPFSDLQPVECSL